MTLNQVIKRLQDIALSNSMVKGFVYNGLSEWLEGADVTYPCCFVEQNNSTISTSGRVVTHQLRVYFLDLVNVSTDAKENEQEVLSDMLSVAQDFVYACKAPAYESPADDRLAWFTTGDAPVTLLKDKLKDVTAGVSIDLPISTTMDIDRCAIPE